MMYLILSASPRCGVQLMQRCCWAAGIELWGAFPAAGPEAGVKALVGTRQYAVYSAARETYGAFVPRGSDHQPRLQFFDAASATALAPSLNLGRQLPCDDITADYWMGRSLATENDWADFLLEVYAAKSGARWGVAASDVRITEDLLLAAEGLNAQIIVMARAISSAWQSFANPGRQSDAWKFSMKSAFCDHWRHNMSMAIRHRLQVVQLEGINPHVAASAIVRPSQPIANMAALEACFARDPARHRIEVPNARDRLRRRPGT